MMDISFTIPGKAVGKGRPRFARRGNFVTTYTPEKTASFENLVKLRAAEAMKGRQMIEGPANVTFRMHITPPASWSKKKRDDAINGKILPTVKPDVDNVLKLICDACNGIVWRDDKQACDGGFSKRYASISETVVMISEIHV